MIVNPEQHKSFIHCILIFFSVPHISTYDVFVTEGVDDVASLIFNRTGGDLTIRTRILARTVAVSGEQFPYTHIHIVTSVLAY